MNDVAPRSNRLDAIESRLIALEKRIAAFEAEFQNYAKREHESGLKDLELIGKIIRRVNALTENTELIMGLQIKQCDYLWPEKTPEIKAQFQEIMTRRDKPL